MNEASEQHYFHEARVVYEGRAYELTIETCLKIQGRGYYWHAPGDPSSWLAVEIYREAKEIVGNAGRNPALELAAKALGITVDSLLQTIDWHENYMRWHDGDSDYSAL